MTRPALRLDTLALGLGAALFVGYLLVTPPRLNHDVAQYLSGGLVLVEGGRPYVEVVDTNPPMILYLSAAPAAVSVATGWPLDRVGLVFLAALFAGAFALFARTLRAVLPDDDARRRAVVLVGAGWLWLLIGTHCAPGVPQFGQRDALIGAFVLPFLALRHGRYHGAAPPGRAVAVAAGVLALVAAGMKPHFLLVLAALDGALALSARRGLRVRTPETVAFVAAGLVYALHFFAVPGMASFYAEWLGYMSRGYPAYDAEAGAVLATFALGTPLGAGLPLALAALASGAAVAVGLRARDAGLRLAATVGALGLLSAVVYVAQAKGWAYQALPLQVAAVTALGLGGAHALGGVARRTGPVVAQALPAALVLGLVAATLGPPIHPHPALAQALEAHSEPDDRVLVLSPRVRSAWPALTHAGRRPAGRYLTTYPLAFFYHDATGYAPPDAWAAEEAAFYADLERTVREERPRLLVVNVSPGPHGTPPWFRVDAYLERRGFFEGPGAAYVPVDTVRVPEVGRHAVLARRAEPVARRAAPSPEPR